MNKLSILFSLIKLCILNLILSSALDSVYLSKNGRVRRANKQKKRSSQCRVQDKEEQIFFKELRHFSRYNFTTGPILSFFRCLIILIRHLFINTCNYLIRTYFILPA